MRFLLKLSGELLGDAQLGDFDAARAICCEIQQAKKISPDIEIIIVVGGGNIMRGRSTCLSSESLSNKIGITATIVNALILSDLLSQTGIDNSVLTSLDYQIIDHYDLDVAINLIKSKKIIIIACGLGVPFFTSDTASAVYGKELEVNRILKATNVDGVFNRDPKICLSAKRYESVSFHEILKNELSIIDLTSAAFCQTYNMEMMIYNGLKQGNTLKALCNENVGTLVVC